MWLFSQHSVVTEKFMPSLLLLLLLLPPPPPPPTQPPPWTMLGNQIFIYWRGWEGKRRHSCPSTTRQLKIRIRHCWLFWARPYMAVNLCYAIHSPTFLIENQSLVSLCATFLFITFILSTWIHILKKKILVIKQHSVILLLYWPLQSDTPGAPTSSSDLFRGWKKRKAHMK